MRLQRSVYLGIILPFQLTYKDVPNSSIEKCIIDLPKEMQDFFQYFGEKAELCTERINS